MSRTQGNLPVPVTAVALLSRFDSNSQSMTIHWYPSHMAKAEKALAEILPKIDVLIEVRDARIPLSSANPSLGRLALGKPRVVVLAKSDLADASLTARWIEFIRRQEACEVTSYAAPKQAAHKLKPLLELCHRLAPNRNSAVKPLRLFVVGVPNCGKSTLLNALAARKIAKTGDEPGVTKGQQMVRIDATLFLCDTPGLLWPRFEDPAVGYRLAVCGSVRDTSLEESDVARAAIEIMVARYPKRLCERYGIASESGPAVDVLHAIGRSRGCLVRGGEVDATKAAQILLRDLRSGALGKLTLESPDY